MQLQGQTGPQRVADGSTQNFRLDKNASTVIAQSQGRYYESTSRGLVFSAATQAAATTGAGLSATSVIFTLYNPIGSGVLISLLDIGIGVNAPPAAATVIYLVQNNNANQAAPATTTALNVVCNNMASTSGQAKAYSAATLPAAPSVLRILASLPTTSATGIVIKDEIAGAIVLQPGTMVSVQSTTAAALFAHITWQENSIV